MANLKPAIFTPNNPTAPRICPELAVEIGLNESLILLQLEFWIRLSGSIQKDGRYWIYESLTDFQGIFSFWSLSTINRAILSLEEKKLICIGNFNKYKYDRTRWFCLNSTGIKELKTVCLIDDWAFQNESSICQNDKRSMQNETRPSQNDTTIPDLSPDLSPENTVVADAPSVPDTPTTFGEWHKIIKETNNRQAVLRQMCETLYPGLDPPAFSYIGKVARKVGGAGRLADLLWQHSTRPPTGDLLAYIQGVAKGNGRANTSGHSTPTKPGSDSVETIRRKMAAAIEERNREAFG